MEFGILIGIIFVGLALYMWNTRRRDDVKPAEPAPYKVEPTPVAAVAEPVKCGCGRSPTGLCVGLHKLTVEEWSIHPDNVNKVVEAEPAKKVKAKAPKSRAVATAGKKPAAKKSSAGKAKR